MKLPFPQLLGAACALALFTSTGAAVEDFYVGTYTHFFGSKGIYHYQFDPATGAISGGQLAVKTPSPSFLVIHPNHRWVYAVEEAEEGRVDAFAIEPNAQLRMVDGVCSNGSGPCHLSLDRTHRYVFVANYNSGSVAAMPIKKGGGVDHATGFDQHHGTGPNTVRQEGPHAHSIYADASNRFVYACDLGTDKIVGYRFDAATGKLKQDAIATTHIAGGSGPRHLVMSRNGFVYLINEMSNTVTVLRRDEATGAMHTIQTVSTLPAGFKDTNTTAEIALHPNGRFLYASNRGHNSIAIFAVADNGRLTPLDRVSTQGKTPRNFSFDPSGRWLLAANQDTNDIFVYKVNGATGRLTPVGGRTRVGNPVCIAFLPPR